jgi:hypothetical protein
MYITFKFVYFGSCFVQFLDWNNVLVNNESYKYLKTECSHVRSYKFEIEVYTIMNFVD